MTDLSDYKNWPKEKQDAYFAAEARAYSERQADAKSGFSVGSEPAFKVAAAKPHVSLICGATIKPEPIAWVWPNWLARGKAHILGGQPGTGKTTLAMWIASRVTTGGAFPDGTKCAAGNVVIWSGEDDPADTLVPRLITSGADVSRVFFVGDVREGSAVRSFDPAKDVEPLREAVRKAGGAVLIIVDPIVSAVAGDSHKNGEVRRALQPLVDLASSMGAALLGITHFSKGTGGREPVERLNGSLAFGALARVVMVAAKKQSETEGEQAKRIFCRAKSNIGPDDGGFIYELRQDELRAYPGVFASSIVWGESLDGSARELLAAAEDVDPDGGGRSEAEDFLRDFLADGPVLVKEVEAAAKAHGLAWRTVERAKKAAGVEAQRSGFGPGGGWKWHIAHRPPKGASKTEPDNVATYGGLCCEEVEVEI
jgi:hypothetical protein